MWFANPIPLLYERRVWSCPFQQTTNSNTKLREGSELPLKLSMLSLSVREHIKSDARCQMLRPLSKCGNNVEAELQER